MCTIETKDTVERGWGRSVRMTSCPCTRSATTQRNTPKGPPFQWLQSGYATAKRTRN